MSARAIHEKIVALTAEMEKAAADMDFEAAARLRNQIAALRGTDLPGAADGEVTSVTVSQPPPGAMGLGTQVPVRERPRDWKPPRKPDPMTANHKPRGKRGR